MGQSIKSGKELVEHPDQLLGRQGRGEVGKSFNICKKNTRQQGRDGVGRKHINILIYPGRHITIQTNQLWSEISALLATGVSRNASVFNKHLSREPTQGFRKDKQATESPSSCAGLWSVGNANNPKGNFSLGTDQFIVESKMKHYEFSLYFHNEQQSRRHEHRAKWTWGQKNAKPHYLQPNDTHILYPKLQAKRVRHFSKIVGIGSKPGRP